MNPSKLNNFLKMIRAVGVRHAVFSLALFSFILRITPDSEAKTEFPACTAETPKGTLCQAQLDELHPGQLTIGMVDVQQKINELSELGLKGREKYLQTNHAIGVIGPGGSIYLIDRHHTSRAAWETAQGKAPAYLRTYLMIEENLSTLSEEDFWKTMQERSWIWLKDEDAVLHSATDLARMHIQDLKDDRYRSLAWTVRRLGGFKKTTIPFAEFYWGERFRQQGIDPGHSPKEFKRAVKEALARIHEQSFADLPGYLGNFRPFSEFKDKYTDMKCSGLFKVLKESP